MRSPIKNMFTEVRYELVKIILLNVFLSTIIVFLLADIIGLIFSMPIWYAVAAGALYFIIMMVVEIRKITLSHVERTNPDLHEILRTAKDNMNEDNLMAHALFYEVLDKMKRVSSGSFLSFRTMMVKIVIIFLLASVPVTVAFFNLNIQKFDDPLARPLAVLGGFFGKVTGKVPDATNATNANGDVFGDPSMARLGNQQLTATINPSLSNPDFSSVDPSNPSSNPLADLGQGQAGFNTPTSEASQTGITPEERDAAAKFGETTRKQ